MTIDPLLLDTCAAIWTVGDDPLTLEADRLLSEVERAGAGIYVSPITAWEVGLLSARGKLRSPLSAQDWFDALLALPGVRLASLPPAVLIASSSLPGDLHKDPADRILAATARAFGYTLVTRDDALLAYAQQGHLRAVRC